MTLVAPETYEVEPCLEGIHELITPGTLRGLQTVMNRALRASVSSDNPLLFRVVAESIEAFVACDGAAKPAASRVAPLLWQIGDHLAQKGFDADDLARSFRRAHKAAQHGLPFAIGATLPHDTMNVLRQHVIVFLQHLQRHAWIGWERTQVIMAMPDDERLDQLGQALRRPTDQTMLKRLAECSGFDLSSNYVLIVATAGDIDGRLLDHPESFSGANRSEAFVPAGWSLDKLADLLTPAESEQPVQVVVGPPVALSSIAETTALTRRGAELLCEGLTSDPRMVVPCTDLLASLVVDGNPRLTDLIVAKHLGPMGRMTPHRRLAIGDFLLQWLERGLPVNQLARAMGIPAQTAHSRLKSIRSLFGAAMDDPTQRLELTVALQAALPRWRAEASSKTG